MAQQAAAAPRPSDSSTKDIDRFWEYARHGAPGPHYYVVLLGLEAFDLPHLLRSVEKGFSYRTLERFLRNVSLPFEQLSDFIDISRRTLIRRKHEGRLLPSESDRLLRASRLFGKTLELFEGDRDAANEWLTSPQPALGGSVPLELARTEVGAREVEAVVDRLERGIFL